MITPNAVLVRSNSLVSAPIGDEVAMMDVDSGTFYMLDDIGSFIWSSLTTATRVADLLVDIQGRYDVEPEQCEADVLALLEDLHDRGLVRVGD